MKQTNNVSRVTAACLALILAGCTHLETRPTAEVQSVPYGEGAAKGAQRGLSYSLPMLQYDLKITRSLSACPQGAALPAIATKVVAAERYVAGERFEVDYEALTSVMKTSSFDVAYHESGTLKSINASAADQTGTVLTDIARIGLAVAGASAGAPANLVTDATGLEAAASVNFKAMLNATEKVRAERAPIYRLACTEDALKAIAARERVTADIKKINVELAGLTRSIEMFTALAAVEALGEKERLELAGDVRASLNAEERLEVARTALAEAEKVLGVAEEAAWPTKAGDAGAHTDTLAASAAALAHLRSLFVLATDSGASPAAAEGVAVACGSAEQVATVDHCLATLGAIKLRLFAARSLESRSPGPAGTPYRTTGVIANSSQRWAKGIFIREPEEARLVACPYGGEPAESGCVGSKTLLRDKLLVAPQLGRLRLLPFTNGLFEESELELSMRANGFVEKFKYGEKSAAARASGSFAGIAEKVEAGLEKMEQERASDIKFAQEQRTYARTEAAALRTDEIARLTYQIDLNKKEADRFASEAALLALADSPEKAAEQARLDADVKTLQSQLARLKAAAEIKSMTPPADDD